MIQNPFLLLCASLKPHTSENMGENVFARNEDNDGRQEVMLQHSRFGGGAEARLNTADQYPRRHA